MLQLLLDLAALLLARTLTRERLLGASTIAGLQIERMLLDILDDIFLLHFAFEATKRAFDRFAFLNLDFSHAVKHPLRGHLCANNCPAPSVLRAVGAPCGALWGP